MAITNQEHVGKALELLNRGTPVRGRKRSIDILFDLDHPDGPPSEVPGVEDPTGGDDDDFETDGDETDRDEGVGGSGDDDDDETLDVLVIEDII